MLDTVQPTRRALPLATQARVRQAGVDIQPGRPEARFSLRVRLADGEALVLQRLRLDAPINSVTTQGGTWLARLGPDEWLVGAPEIHADLVRSAVAESLRDRSHALVDVSHRNVGIDVSGKAAAVLLNAGCPLDLGVAFPAGSATRTLLGKAEIVLLRPGSEPRYRVECWRSFAGYVHAFLVEAAYGLGGADAP